MARMSEKELKNSISNFNDNLIKAGSPYRLVWSPRNGYQGVDAVKEGSGACRNIEVGTARECWDAANRFSIDKCRERRTEQLRHKLAVLESTFTNKNQKRLYTEIEALLPKD